MSPRRAALIAIVLASAVAALACSSSSKPAQVTKSAQPAPVESPLPTILPPLTKPLELPTIEDPLELPLETRSGKRANFMIDVPKEWEQDDTGGRDQFSLKIGPYTGALFIIECGEPRARADGEEYTARGLAEGEVKSLQARPRLGSVDGGINEFTINGRPAAEYDDNRTVGFGVGTTGSNFFIADEQCAWTLRFVITGNTTQLGAYRQLFGRIVSSLRAVGPSR